MKSFGKQIETILNVERDVMNKNRKKLDNLITKIQKEIDAELENLGIPIVQKLKDGSFFKQSYERTIVMNKLAQDIEWKVTFLSQMIAMEK